MGNCTSLVVDIMYYIQKFSYCIAMLAVSICLLVTLVVTLGVGIGMGYHYAVVEHKSIELKLLANDSASKNTSNVKPSRRDLPLETTTLSEEIVPIKTFATNRRRRHEEITSRSFTDSPDSVKLNTLPINTFEAQNNSRKTADSNSNKETEKMRFMTMAQLLRKIQAFNNITRKEEYTNEQNRTESDRFLRKLRSLYWKRITQNTFLNQLTQGP